MESEMTGKLFNPLLIPEILPKILKSLPITLQMAGCAFVFGSLIALGITALNLSKNKAARTIASGYVHFIRGIPSLILIYLLYLGFPQLMKRAFGVDMTSVPKPAYMVAIFSLAISANFSEMMRSAYLSIDKGQKEAALSVGMTGFEAFRRILFPQAFGVALPTLGNNIIMLMKLTSLGFVVGVVDLMGKSRILSTLSYGTQRLEVYVSLGLIYWAICAFLEQANRQLVKAYSKGKKTAIGS